MACLSEGEFASEDAPGMHRKSRRAARLAHKHDIGVARGGLWSTALVAGFRFALYLALAESFV
jgi:hypothetical protein